MAAGPHPVSDALNRKVFRDGTELRFSKRGHGR